MYVHLFRSSTIICRNSAPPSTHPPEPSNSTVDTPTDVDAISSHRPTSIKGSKLLGREEGKMRLDRCLCCDSRDEMCLVMWVVTYVYDVGEGTETFTVPPLVF